MIHKVFLITLISIILISCNSTKGLTSKEEPFKIDLVSPAGYRYIVHKGDAIEKIKVGDYAYFHVDLFKGDSLINSSRKDGEVVVLELLPTDPNEKLVPPVIEGLRLMGKGDSLTIFLPTDSIPDLPPLFREVKELQYDIILLDIKNKDEYEAEINAKKQAEEKMSATYRARENDVANLVQDIWEQYDSGKLDSKIKTTASGLKLYIHEKGNGNFPKSGENVSVHYYAIYALDGKTFDDSFSSGQVFDFPLGKGRVIKGWDEGIALIEKQGSGFLFIPSELAYGTAGSPPIIGPDAELVFYVEVIK